MTPIFALKIDVDTARGTRDGVPNLLRLLDELGIKATFLFSLGPDNTGRALKRIFRPGFLRKVIRSNVPGLYPWQTLFSGVFWPGPSIARHHASVMREVQTAGHEIGIHSYDHNRWQDKLAQMTAREVSAEFSRARDAFVDVFNQPAQTAGAAGWQANAYSLAAYDEATLVYASDCRGTHPFYPHIHGKVFKTLQVPTTLPTLDELLGRPGLPEAALIAYYMDLLKVDQPNIFTLHAEIEGQAKITWFRQFLMTLQQQTVIFKTTGEIAATVLQNTATIPVCNLIQNEVAGRSGKLAMQGVPACNHQT